MTYFPPHISRFEVEIPGAPDVLQIAPKTVADVETVMRFCTEKGLIVQVHGGGTHSGFGSPPVPDIVLSTRRLDDIETWEPDDLTIVVGAGATVEATEAMLAESNQTLVMPEHPGDSTLGGVVSAGVSPLRRGRLYATRERVLEVTMVTGDGRRVRSGGRVVKNVTGYDLHRLAVGAFGSLGVIVSLCLKLWPVPPEAATVTVEGSEQADILARPLAVLEHDGTTDVFLQGTGSDVEGQANRLRGSVREGHHWPPDPEGVCTWSLRVPPGLTRDAIDRLPDGWSYLALHGVGEIRLGSPDAEGHDRLRKWAEASGGHLVVTGGAPEAVEPWGRPPSGIDIQRRLIAEFDPGRVLNPGRLPGGL